MQREPQVNLIGVGLLDCGVFLCPVLGGRIVQIPPARLDRIPSPIAVYANPPVVGGAARMPEQSSTVLDLASSTHHDPIQSPISFPKIPLSQGSKLCSRHSRGSGFLSGRIQFPAKLGEVSSSRRGIFGEQGCCNTRMVKKVSRTLTAG